MVNESADKKTPVTNPPPKTEVSNTPKEVAKDLSKLVIQDSYKHTLNPKNIKKF